jgi:peroxiredoxin
MNLKIPILCFFLLFSTFLHAQKASPLKTGTWQGELQLNGSTRLPFYFEVKKNKGKTTVEIMNGEEKIVVDEITETADSIKFKMPLYDSEFLCEIKPGGKELEGEWFNHAKKENNEIPFKAWWGREYNCDKSLPVFNALKNAKWEVTFSPNTPQSTKAIGLFQFNSSEHKLTGTFLTESGDYRYLSGYACTDWAYLSCFDGAHAYFFRWKIQPDSTLTGDFYSGSQGYEKWIAKRNPRFELRNADSLTYLKKGYDRIDFKFKNTEGLEVSSRDEKFKNKVLVIQIMGTWCPNCMDETRYYAELYPRYKDKGLEVVALAFEKSTDPVVAKATIMRWKSRFQIGYDILVTSKTGAAGASEALPMLNAVWAFPTTIYVDKKGRVRKIYTGFSGPGTGSYYEKYKEENERFLEKLLME